MKLTIIIAINHFVIMVNFCNRFDKALTEIFQFCRALLSIEHKFVFTKTLLSDINNEKYIVRLNWPPLECHVLFECPLVKENSTSTMADEN